MLGVSETWQWRFSLSVAAVGSSYCFLVLTFVTFSHTWTSTWAKLGGQRVETRSKSGQKRLKKAGPRGQFRWNGRNQGRFPRKRRIRGRNLLCLAVESGAVPGKLDKNQGHNSRVLLNISGDVYARRIRRWNRLWLTVESGAVPGELNKNQGHNSHVLLNNSGDVYARGELGGEIDFG